MGKLFDDGPVLIILIVAVIVIFGSKRLPDAARGIGRSLRIFKAETKGLMTDDSGQPTTAQQQPAAQPVVQQPIAPPVAQPPLAPPVAQPPLAPPVVSQPVTPEAEHPQA
jgi:sec-independent protein translocase protein TatA